jgi:glycosyltransferase involved in cell wall biosynthesis
MMRVVVPPSRSRVSVFCSRYPCATEGFVKAEIAALRAAGFAVQVVSCDPENPRIATDDVAPFRTLDGARRRRAVRAAVALLRHPAHAARLGRLAFGGPTGRLSLAALSSALTLRAAVRAFDPCHLRAHFAHLPAAVAWILSADLSIPYSIAAHARDVFVPQLDLARICEDARFVTVCSQAARSALTAQLSSAAKPRIIDLPHGVDLERFSFRRRRDDRSGELRIASVGRLVRKKGADVLIECCRILRDRGMALRCRIAGEGPERPALEHLVREARLDGVELLGELSECAIASLHAWADIFALACRTAEDGDRDGIPNAVLEAQASGLPVVVAAAGGIAEAVEHGRTGLVVAPSSPLALADAVAQYAASPALAARIAGAARTQVERRFDARRAHAELITLLAADPVALER